MINILFAIVWKSIQLEVVIIFSQATLFKSHSFNPKRKLERVARQIAAYWINMSVPKRRNTLRQISGVRESSKLFMRADLLFHLSKGGNARIAYIEHLRFPKSFFPFCPLILRLMCSCVEIDMIVFSMLWILPISGQRQWMVLGVLTVRFDGISKSFLLVVSLLEHIYTFAK